jgi:NitT/TauT family transport system substrate-binding protein
MTKAAPEKRSLAAGAALAAVAMAVIAASHAQAADAKAWRHGIIEAKSDSGLFFMPFKGDFAKKQGLDVDLLQIKTDTVGLKALIAGELESFEGGPQGAIVAASRGADVKIIGCHWVVVPHGLFVRDNINSLKDLQGKSIAVSAPGTFPELVAKAAFEKQGVSYSTVKFAALGGDSDRYKALVAGVVDGAVVSNEYTPFSAKDHVKELVAGRDAAPNFVRVCLMSTSKVLAARHDDAVKFLTAEMQGLRYALTHRDETIKLTFDTTGAKPDDPRPAFVFDQVVKYKSVDPTLPLPMEKLDAMMKIAVSSGAMQKPADLSKIVDGSIRAEAAKRAGQ